VTGDVGAWAYIREIANQFFALSLGTVYVSPSRGARFKLPKVVKLQLELISVMLEVSSKLKELAQQ
jgi:hypothetical protein